jgi:glycosyltransferase involved in cell wall biosynthesis
LFASAGLSFVEKGALALYARLWGVPAILAVRSGAFMNACKASLVFRRVAALLLRAPRFVICQGSIWQQFYSDIFGLPASRCPVVDGWAATSQLLEEGERRIYDSRGTVQLLFVGWVERAKGVFELLESVEQLVVREGIDVSLTLAGRGSALVEAQSWVRTHSLNSRVTFAGWVDGPEKTSLYAAADIFVLPSYAEGLPNSMIEAMAAGLPVVVTSVGSIPDAVHDSYNGLLVPPRDVTALTRALLRLSATPTERQGLGTAARAVARERFGVERAAEVLTTLINTAAFETAD